MVTEAKVVLKAFCQTYHCKWIRFTSSTSESGSGGSGIDDFVLRFSYKHGC